MTYLAFPQHIDANGKLIVSIIPIQMILLLLLLLLLYIGHDIFSEIACFHCRQVRPGQPELHSEESEESELHPVKVSKDIFHRWGIDMVDPLQQTARGNTYIITATEYLAK